ncbi:uncharacterized protein Thert_01798 [Thermoanaerobacterium thermosaccharolyticum]|uniref:Uncharacterized protein n=1 Tax=Thermoanaerobacterium thermosaccharolyticum TaxID=1517 RepID=A0A223HZ85_THETR|nr:uncharacterized protein Thert_01798 [Thermoanaerobacterium thermosaccharolyticum]
MCRYIKCGVNRTKNIKNQIKTKIYLCKMRIYCLNNMVYSFKKYGGERFEGRSL